jgi:hypothetical protein
VARLPAGQQLSPEQICRCRSGRQISATAVQGHDAIKAVIIVMLEEAGFRDVKDEDVWWDAAATYFDAEHRRPDITCFDPRTNTHYVFDVVVAWGASMGYDEEGTEWGIKMAAVLASRREDFKRRRYRRAFWAKVREGMTAAQAVAWADAEDARDCGETAAAMDAVIAEQRHVFVPLGFEANGAWGASTLQFFDWVRRSVGRLAGDKYHWSASHWGEHWRQRIDAVLARGQAALVTAAVGKSRNSGKKRTRTTGAGGASPCWSPTFCPPCAPPP